ncbi:MAG: LysR family transcriptional regulator [Pseudomonas sp.]|nr:LysR family transcriptional regulator [Pseudomonas sp.]
MTLTQLEIFVSVAERRGFTLAAAQLKISQSAVSHAIRALEQEWGVEILRRHQGQIELTDIGARLLQRVQPMLGLAAAIRQDASDALGMKLGTLRIGSFGPTSSQRLLPRILKDYRRLYPGIEIHVSEGPDRQVMEWLLDRKVDVGFVTLPETQFDTWPLIEDQMVALLPITHFLASSESVTLGDLCFDPFVLTEAGSSELVSQLFAAYKLQPRVRYRTSQLMSTLAAVSRGDGVTVVAESSLPEVGDALYVVKALNPAVKRQVGIAVLDRSQVTAAAQAFLGLAEKIFRGR